MKKMLLQLKQHNNNEMREEKAEQVPQVENS